MGRSDVRMTDNGASVLSHPGAQAFRRLHNSGSSNTTDADAIRLPPQALLPLACSFWSYTCSGIHNPESPDALPNLHQLLHSLIFQHNKALLSGQDPAADTENTVCHRSQTGMSDYPAMMHSAWPYHFLGKFKDHIIILRRFSICIFIMKPFWFYILYHLPIPDRLSDTIWKHLYYQCFYMRISQPVSFFLNLYHESFLSTLSFRFIYGHSLASLLLLL